MEIEVFGQVLISKVKMCSLNQHLQNFFMKAEAAKASLI